LEINNEIVVRKGFGNSDSLCDGISEFISTKLCEQYIKDYGEIQPHEVNNCRILSGVTEPEFGGGNIIYPSTIYVDGVAAPIGTDIEELVSDAIIEYLGNVTPLFDINEFLISMDEGPQNPEFDEWNYFKRSPIPEFGLGYSTSSDLEDIVVRIENEIIPSLRQDKNSPIGHDITVYGQRTEDKTYINIICAMIDENLNDNYEYLATVDEMTYAIKEEIKEELTLVINDGNEYLTTMGTFAECGNNGNLGVGNNCNGVMNPFFPMNKRGISGQDPQFSVEKHYSILCTQMCQMIVELTELTEMKMFMMVKQGRPMEYPNVIDMSMTGELEDEKEIKNIIGNLMDLDITQFSTF